MLEALVTGLASRLAYLELNVTEAGARMSAGPTAICGR